MGNRNLYLTHQVLIKEIYIIFLVTIENTKRYFFHNANSVIKRRVWKKFKFDEKTPI